MPLTPHTLSLYLLTIFLSLFHKTTQQTTDTFSTYSSGTVTAMDIDYTSSVVAFANTNKEIVRYSTTGAPGVAIGTLATGHKAEISMLALSPNGSLVLSGGHDYTARVYNLVSSTLLCTFDQLRGDIISGLIASDNNFYAFASNEGYLYYGYITNCSKTVYNQTDLVMEGLEIVETRSQIWVIDGKDRVLVVNYLTQSVSSYLLPTSKVNSIFELTSVGKIGLCTERAFYVYSYTGTLEYTLPNPTVYTRRCQAFLTAGNTYFITAISQAKGYTQGTAKTALWNIWRFDAGTNTADMYLEQKNTGGRYPSPAIPKDARAIQVGQQIIIVISIADGYSAYYNNYRDTGTTSCSTGYFKNTFNQCQKCNWDITRAYCTRCTPNAPSANCQQCNIYTYLDASNICQPCPTNCYACSSSTTCTACVGGYTLISGSCLVSNLTGCINSFSYTGSGSTVSKCTECEIGYFPEYNLQCKACGDAYPNCTECSNTTCFSCMPNFLLSSINSCQICSHAIQGCAACINQTYCDTCYENYPYFSLPTAGARNCKKTCAFPCATCVRTSITTCLSCDANRTISGTTCICLPQYPIIDPTTQQCRACSDYLSNCLNCTSSTFCTVCDTSYYFQDTNSTHQSCQTCNYTCTTCTINWYECASCDASVFRVLDPVSKRCVCQSTSYFQMGTQLACEECQNHINLCSVCYNQSYCVTCASSYYVKSTGSGTNTCDSCQAPCSQCYGNSSNCTSCSYGRQLNLTTHTCDCLTGYYSSTPTSCAPCSPVLGSCLQCTNTSVCGLCWENNYFVMVGGKKMCDLCQSTCLTCSVWNNICATCDPLAKRVLDPVTKQCPCMPGYTETSGRCLNCTSTFQFCTSCDGARCFACQPGYSLAYGGLKCVDCATTYPGCTQCLNGVCAACNVSAGYQLSYSKCICSPGYYFKQLDCLPYVIGDSVQRLFVGYPIFEQDANTSLITISIYFRCQGLKIPYGITNSVSISINSQPILQYTVTQKNTTLIFTFMPPSALPQAQIKIEFTNRTIYDLDQYGPKDRTYIFKKNLFFNARYELSEGFGTAFQKYIIPAVRWMSSILVLLGSADLILMLIFTVHLLPAFLLLNISPPIPLQNLLKSIVSINQQSLFIFADIQTSYQSYDIIKQNEKIWIEGSKYMEVFGIKGGVVNRKIMDLVFLGAVVGFYAVVCPRLTPYIPEGKMKKLWTYKFQLKKYSTITNTLLCLLPSFLFCSILDFRMDIFNPSSYFTLSIAMLLLAFSLAYIFVHSMILYSTQFNDSYKNQDCYFGSSILQPMSISYILSLLGIGITGIGILGILDGIYATVLLIGITLWNIGHFRYWDNFPNKILYFLKLFYAICFLFFCTSFLIFTISEKYAVIEIKTVELLGLISLVMVIVLFSLACLETVFLVGYGVYKNCKHSANLVDNIQQEKEYVSQNSHDASTVYNLKLTLAEKQEQEKAFNAKLTNKQEHMKKFREQHLKTATGKMYERSGGNGNRTQQNFRTSGASMKNKKGK